MLTELSQERFRSATHNVKPERIRACAKLL